MGREQELMYAAQNGNLQKLDNILAPKEKRFRGSFFGKGLKINWQDESGYTALHFAALNGHNEAVVMLLQNDASTYMPDNAGNYPLHLAAFNGHSEVARTLINKGPSRANVNEQNGSGDSALHIAAQYGHRTVVQVLLECHADASTRNEKGESPLDLASQYGKLTCVQLIVLSHPYLLHESQTSHSPLHLASRNGHTNVVGALIECGMSVNVMCDLGTPLHEAALYGKISTVKILLRKGVDVRLRNSKGETVLDVLVNHPSQRSQQITALIYEHSTVLDPNAGNDEMRSKSRSYSGIQEDQLRTSERPTSKSATVPRNKSQGLSYDTVPPPRPHSSAKPSNEPRSSPIGIQESSPHYALVTLPKSNNRESNDLEWAAISPSPITNSNSGSYENNDFTFSRQSPSNARTSATLPLPSSPSTRNQYDLVPGVKQRRAASDADLSNTANDQPPNRMSVPSFPSLYDTVNSKGSRSISLSAAGEVQSPQPPDPEAVAYQIHDLFPPPDNSKPDLCIINEEGFESAARQDSYDNVQITGRPITEDNENMKGDPTSISETYTEIKPMTKIKQSRTNSKANNHDDVYSSSMESATSQTAGSLNSDSRPFNEAYEWTKIDDLLTSMKEFTLEFEGSDNRNMFDADSVGSWLATIGLPQYEPSFIANGFDDIRFLGGDVLEEADLMEIGIQDYEHIKSIIKAARNLPRTPRIGDRGFPMPSSVADWLLAIELNDYESSFSRRGYDNMDRVRVLWELELSTVIDVGLVGHRKRMIYSLGDRPELRGGKKSSWAEKFASANQRSSHLQNDAMTDDSIDVAKQLLETAASLASGFANRHNSGSKSNMVVTVSSSTSEVSTCDAGNDAANSTRDQATGSDTQTIQPITEQTDSAQPSSRSEPPPSLPQPHSRPSSNHIEPETSPNQRKWSQSDDPALRIPEPLLNDIPIRAHWKHRPEVLLYEAAVYSTQYLGSHPVTKVTGTSSTLEACDKMKRIAENLQKIPSILLSINARGIEFIDAQSKHTISSYGIKNISYCAQDPQDLRVFAYITKDKQTQRNYCHVFKAASLPLADEIVLTIGQSFELAYERHIRLVQIRQQAKKQSNKSGPSPLSPSATKSNAPPLPKPYSDHHN